MCICIKVTVEHNRRISFNLVNYVALTDVVRQVVRVRQIRRFLEIYVMNIKVLQLRLYRRVTGAVGQPVIGTLYDPSEELPSSKLRYAVGVRQTQSLQVPYGPRVENLWRDPVLRLVPESEPLCETIIRSRCMELET